LITLNLSNLFAQNVHRADTLVLPGGDVVEHIMLKLEIPTGESFVRTSGCQGSAIYRLAVPDSQDHYKVETRQASNGTYFCNLSLTPPKPPKDPGLAANLRLAEPLSDLETYTTSGEYKTFFCPDPTVATDLYLDLGVGASRLDLSGLHLAGGEITIRSGVGGLVLILDEEQPVELRLKSGFFSEVNMPETGFKEISEGTYINQAVQESPNERIIIRLEVDFGKINIIEQ